MTNKPVISISEAKSILVISMRYFGDVLLITPLLRSLKTAYPAAQLDVLVFDNTAAMLEGNPDINQVITITKRASLAELWQLLKKIFKQYDLAIATQAGDRPFFYSILASTTAMGVVPKKNNTGWWKRFFFQAWIEHDEHQHAVLQNTALLELIGVNPQFILVPPQPREVKQLTDCYPFLLNTQGFAVLHFFPQWKYKQWTKQAWIEVSDYIHAKGLTLVFSGGQAQEEMNYVDDIQSRLTFEAINLSGQTTLAQLAAIIAHAKLYIGPDTGITHLAAATGVPMIALYGPTNPEKWSPWPLGFNQNTNPFARVGSRQCGNVSLIQGTAACVPCQLEGCDRHRLSRSRCLDELSAKTVIQEIDRILD